MPAKKKPAKLGAPSQIVVMWPIAKFKPYGANPRKNDHVVDQMVASIREFGFKIPMLARSDGEIVDGHLRLKAALKLDLKTLPTILCDEWTPAQVRAFRLMVNKSVEWADWDAELLNVELAELKAADYDLSFTGFDPSELEGMADGSWEPPTRESQKPVQVQVIEGLTDEDAVPEPPVIPITVLGDLWLLGGHRVLCGDSTSVDAVERLMAGEKAGLMATDPPYGVKYDSAEIHEHGRSLPAIQGDSLQDAELQQFLSDAFSAALVALRPDAAWYLWHADLTQGFFAAAAAAAHVILHRQIIWVKPVLVFGRGQYHWKHEPCFMGWVEGHQPPDFGDHTETTVWESGRIAQKERDVLNHPTPKPVDLFARPIRKHLKRGEVCYEPFAGSGPQFIAAETEGMRCFGLELEPRYIDTIVKRWQDFTGKEATLEGDGRTFAELSAKRK